MLSTLAWQNTDTYSINSNNTQFQIHSTYIKSLFTSFIKYLTYKQCLIYYCTLFYYLYIIQYFREVSTQPKDRKGPDLSLPKLLKHQRIILHGYEERSLKTLPKVRRFKFNNVILLYIVWLACLIFWKFSYICLDYRDAQWLSQS